MNSPLLAVLVMIRTGHDCDRNRWCPDHDEQSLQDQLPCLVRTDVRLSTASR
jgi:hypothetical protein